MLKLIATSGHRPTGSVASGMAGAVMTCLLCSTVHAGVGAQAMDRNAPWVESAVCSVAIKSELDANKPIHATTPIDNLVSAPATCTGNVMLRNELVGGVRGLLVNGWRVSSATHQVTTLRAFPSGQVELLISALFVLERPQIVNVPTR